MQGFKKIDSDIWEFANEAFLKGQRHILKNLKRRKAPSQNPPQQQANNPCVEVGRFGLDGEMERLQRDKHVLMMELVKLRQQQQNTRTHLQEMELRLQGTEKKQQKTMSFLAKALQNPEFVQKLSRQYERKELETMIKKRPRPIDQGPSRAYPGESSRVDENFQGLSGFQVSELEELALEMQGIGRSKRTLEEEHQDEDRDFDEEFWQELFDEQFDTIGNEGTLDYDDDEADDVDIKK
ncbi:heat stress transcription factor A-6b [Tanacetum coccineum]